MSNELVETAFRDFVQAAAAGHPAFAVPAGKEYHFYTTGETGDFELPCHGFEMKDSKELVPSPPLHEGTLTISIETQADDETEAVHAARCTATLGFLSDLAGVDNAINAAGQIWIFGFGIMGTSRAVKERSWTTLYDLSVAFAPVPPPP